MPVQLVIKAPNQKIPDHVVDCELQWAVLQLKEHLSEVYPTKPKPEEQRLIYAGRLIKDHLLIKDFINYEEGQKYTLHLVCSQHATTSSPSHHDHAHDSDTRSPNSSSQSSSHLFQRSVSSSMNDDSPAPGTDGISNSPHGLPEANHFLGVPMGGAVSPELMAQQVAAMQHFYAQYMAQFMRHAQLAGFPAAYPDFSSAVVSPVNTPVPPPMPVPAENVPPANVNRAQPGGDNQNIRMNAQGGPLLDDEEDDAENRDWLDWFYIFSRALVLFSILFFYSSLGRFMVVTGVAILIYMYQGGWFGGRQPQAPVAPPVQQAAVQPEEGQNAGPPQRRNAPDEQAQNQERISPPDAPPGNEDEIQNVMDVMDGNREPDHQNRSEPNLIQTFWLFLTSFFVSLIPEQPPPVNIN